MRFRFSEGEAAELWDKRAQSVPEGTIFQTTIMADLVKELHEARPRFLIAEDDAGVVKGQLLFFEGISGVVYEQDIRPFKPLLRRILGTIFWSYGPLIFDRENYFGILGEFLKFIENYARSRHALKVGEVSPPLHDPGIDQEEMKQVFVKYGYNPRRRATVLIELHKGESTLWEELHKPLRDDVNKAVNDGISVEDLTNERDAQLFHAIRLESAKRSKAFSPRLRDIVVERDKNTSHKIMLAKLDGKVIAGTLLRYFNGIVLQCVLDNSNFALKSNLLATHLLTWDAIRWAGAERFRLLDLAGINPDPQMRSIKEEIVYKFKKRWGGRELHYYSYEKPMGKTHSLVTLFKKLHTR